MASRIWRRLMVSCSSSASAGSFNLIPPICYAADRSRCAISHIGRCDASAHCTGGTPGRHQNREGNDVRALPICLALIFQGALAGGLELSDQQGDCVEQTLLWSPDVQARPMSASRRGRPPPRHNLCCKPRKRRAVRFAGKARHVAIPASRGRTLPQGTRVRL